MTIPAARYSPPPAVANIRLRHIIVSMPKPDPTDDLQRLRIDDEREASIQHDLAVLRQRFADTHPLERRRDSE